MATGVTGFIQLEDVRQEIDSTYPNQGTDIDAPLEVPNNGYSHLLIGEAIEFLAHALLRRRCETAVQDTSSRGLTLFGSDDDPTMPVHVFDEMMWEKRPDISSRAEWESEQDARPAWDRRADAAYTYDEALTRLVTQYIETGMNTDGVVTAALYNAGWKPADDVQSRVDRAAIESDLVEEMRDLFALLREQAWPTGDTAILEPRFNSYRHILAGVADCVVDNTLIDIKTTEKPAFTPQYWRQLLLYYTLYDINNALIDAGVWSPDEDTPTPLPEITELGIYFARHGTLQTVAIDEILEDRARFEEFRAWIVDRGIEENRHTQVNYDDIRAVLTDPYEFKRQRTFSDF